MMKFYDKHSKFIAILVIIVMIVSMIPGTGITYAYAQDNEAEIGKDASNPMEVPEEGLVIQDGVLYGISKTWFAENNIEKGDLYISIEIPSSVEQIAADGLRWSYTYDKKKYGAVTYTDKIGTFIVANVDFSNATSLTSIGSQAMLNDSSVSGVIDLSNTKVTMIDKMAFSGCTKITGVILPNTLTALGNPTLKTGSVFSGCSSLNYVKVAGSTNTDAVVEFPDSLTYIGTYTFRNCFAQGVNNVQIEIPESVEFIGDSAFTNNKISQIVINRQSDGLGNRFENYSNTAFNTGNSNSLIIFKNEASYKEYLNAKSVSSTVKKAMTYEVKLSFEGTDIVQKKLNYQSVKYEKNTYNEFWNIDEEYTLPEINDDTNSKAGYDKNWSTGGKALTEASTVNASGDEALAQINYTLQEPTVGYQSDNILSDSSTMTVILDPEISHRAGIKVSHPLLLDEQGDENDYVYFQYSWWDETSVDGTAVTTVNGPRSQSEPELFCNAESSSVYNRVLVDDSVIPINSAADARTGDTDGYLVEIYGYHVKDGETTLFYKSSSNFIYFINSSDTQATSKNCYIVKVNVKLPLKYFSNIDDEEALTKEYYEAGDEVVVAGNTLSRDGYRFTGWNTEKDGTGQSYQAGETLEITEGMNLYAQWEELEHITITPVSLSAYVGGTSANGTHSPKIRYSVSTPEDVALSDLTFTMHTNVDGEDVSEIMHRERINENDEDSYCLFPLLEENLDVDENDISIYRSSFLKAVDTSDDQDILAGVYEISLRSNADDWYITAEDTDGQVYLVDLNTKDEDGDNVAITIRYVSNEEDMYNGNVSNILSAVVTSEDEVDTSLGAVAVAKAGTIFTTNGDEKLGLFGLCNEEGVYVSKDDAKISLLFDDSYANLSLTDEDMKNYTESNGYSFDEWNTQFKYLDLVNENDGNTWVATDTAVTIYWPYPTEEIAAHPENYTFKILHFDGLNREYMNGVNLDDVNLEEMTVTVTDKGLKFDTGSFSPYLLLWQENDNPDDIDNTPSIINTSVTTDENNIIPPKTGDETPIYEYMMLMGISLVGIIAIIALKKRTNK